MTTAIHRQRHEAVIAVLRAEAVRSVVDLGCGDGSFLERLVDEPLTERVVGIDEDRRALARIAARVREDARVTLLEGSVAGPLPPLGQPDAAILVEVIEHLDPSRLHALERVVFAQIAPRLVVITTPNADFNPLLGVPAHRMRHPGHRFEWGRTRFRDWCGAVAARHAYVADFQDVPAAHPHLGGPTQMAVFRRAAEARGKEAARR